MKLHPGLRSKQYRNRRYETNWRTNGRESMAGANLIAVLVRRSEMGIAVASNLTIADATGETKTWFADKR
jgi:hypothetical protein